MLYLLESRINASRLPLLIPGEKKASCTCPCKSHIPEVSPDGYSWKITGKEKNVNDPIGSLPSKDQDARFMTLRSYMDIYSLGL